MKSRRNIYGFISLPRSIAAFKKKTSPFKGVLFLALLSCMSSTRALGPLATFFSQDWETALSFSQHVEKNIEELRKRKAEAATDQARFKTYQEAVQKNLSGLKERAQRARGTELDYVNQELGLTNKIGQVLADIGQTFQDLKSYY